MQTFGNDFQSDYLNVSQIKSLDQLIRQYPGEEVIPQFRKLQQTYPYYRAIRGDGNCFYRAVAFLYLRQAELSCFSNVFEKIDNLCMGHSLYFEDFTFQQKLEQLYNRFLYPLKNTTFEQRQQRLAECFNNSGVFDMIMIMYFRTLNYRYIKQHEKDFIEFVTDRDAIERIRMYRQDSEGIEYQSMAKALKIKIEMKITDQYNLKYQTYNQSQTNKSFEIFFRPGHFDILYHKNSKYLQNVIHRQKKIRTTPERTPGSFDAYNYMQKKAMPYQQNNYYPSSPKRNGRIEEVKKISQTQPSEKKSLFSSTFSKNKFLSNSNQKQKSEKQFEKTKIISAKKQQPNEKNKQKLTESTTFSKKTTVPTQKYAACQGQIINQRQPYQKVKQILILTFFLTGIGYIFFNF